MKDYFIINGLLFLFEHVISPVQIIETCHEFYSISINLKPIERKYVNREDTVYEYKRVAFNNKGDYLKFQTQYLAWLDAQGKPMIEQNTRNNFKTVEVKVKGEKRIGKLVVSMYFKHYDLYLSEFTRQDEYSYTDKIMVEFEDGTLYHGRHEDLIRYIKEV